MNDLDKNDTKKRHLKQHLSSEFMFLNVIQNADKFTSHI